MGADGGVVIGIPMGRSAWDGDPSDGTGGEREAVFTTGWVSKERAVSVPLTVLNSGPLSANRPPLLTNAGR